MIHTPDQRVRVFVSSTIQELAQERTAATEAIRGLKLTPVLFELGARPHPPRKLYRAYLDQSHVFVGIYGKRYGWIAPGMEISGLEDEYLLSGDRPKLIYVKEPSPSREERLKALLGRIEEHDRACYKTFSSPEELGTMLADDLAILLSERFAAAAKAEADELASPAAESTSIAVLAFVNMSPDPDQEYFSDGLSEELLNVLAKIPQLRVISRTSSFQFKGKSEDIRTIAQKLNVAHVLEGSVRKFGKHIRITAQLVDAETGSHRWSETYDRDLDDIFRVQDEIAGEVVEALQLILVDGSLPERQTPLSTEAYTLVLKGRYFSDRRTKDDSATAVIHLKRAVELDPTYAVAWAELARAYATQAGAGFAPVEESVDHARQAAEKSLALDPNLANGHAMLGWIKASYDWEWEDADNEFKRALKLDPGSASLLGNAGALFLGLGRLDESIELLRRGIARDPLQGLTYTNLAISLLYAGRLDEAEVVCHRALELRPGSVSQKYLLARILLAKGKLEAAREAVEEEPDEGWRLAGRALIHHALGGAADSDAALRALTLQFAADMPFQIAEVLGYRGEIDLAFEWLERARTLHDGGLVEMKGNPLLRNLERDPRYDAFLRKMRLPE